MRADRESLAALRQRIAVLEEGFGPVPGQPVTLGHAGIDAALHGGLMRGGLHEIFAPQAEHAPAASGFAAALALRAAWHEGDPSRPVVWIRQDMVESEWGLLDPHGLADLGLDPARLLLVRAADGQGVLRAATEALRCSALGAVLIEPWGTPKALDFTASRRLALAAGQSRVTAFILRQGEGTPASAATTRWTVCTCLSQELEGEAPGHPAFELTLLRHRAGLSGRRWIVEWNRDRCAFAPAGQARRSAPLSRPLASLPADRPVAQDSLRRTG